jgi:Uma2 family endonuclease
MVISLLDEEPMTVEDFMKSKYFDEGIWELYKGELVAMSPARFAHDVIVSRISYLFQAMIGDGDCTVSGPTVGLILDSDKTFIMPDVSVCCDDLGAEENWFLVAPELVVEVLSEGTREICMGKKREIYAGAGSKEYWIIDFEEGWVEVENFSVGLVERWGRGGAVRSWLFPEFEFEVDEILRKY